MAEIVRLGSSEDRRDHIDRSVQLLAGGNLVGLPTETGYVLAASALLPAAVQKLAALGHPLVLLCRTAEEAADYLPQMSVNGNKLLRRAWPGPLQLVLTPAVASSGLFQSLPEQTRQLIGETSLRVRVSSCEVLTEVARHLPCPLIVSDECCHAPLANGSQLVELCGDHASLVLDNGTARFPDGVTVAELNGEEISVTHVGVIAPDSVKRLTADVFLFVCTGNTCRSPMAEALFRFKLAEKLKCDESELAQHGFYVASAGISAGYGMPASPEAAELLRKRQIDLTLHSSQPLTERLLNQADYIYTLTKGHRRAILAERPEMADKVRVLAADGSDVPDPIGSGIDEYERCQATIEAHLDAILAGLPLPPAK